MADVAAKSTQEQIARIEHARKRPEGLSLRCERRVMNLSVGKLPLPE
jgi:hypothetical protein